jgi:murein DD-endopeptidase MepM/ murein hydrolase activator NlpD
MKLHEPVKDFIPKSYPYGDVTQWFGENVALYKNVCPSPGVCMTGGHNGIDIVRPWGEPIYCVESGIVVEALGKETGYGTHVKVLADSGFEYTYGHLSAIDTDCKWGERIEAGQLIGKMGNTGFVVSGDTPFWKSNPYAGTHLHLGRRMVTKWPGAGSWSVAYFSGTDKEYRGIVENYNNGTFGAVPITADDFAAKEYNEVKDITDTIAKVQEVADKQTDPTIKSAFAKAVENLLQRLISLVK